MALAHLDRALDRHPTELPPEPSKHSQYQLLVNQAAMLRWDAEGYEAALTWALARFVRDAPFAYFFWRPWTDRLERERIEPFFAEVRAAYARRRVALPAQAELNSRYVDGLDEELRIALELRR